MLTLLSELAKSRFFSGTEAPLSATLDGGDAASRLAVVAGSNASGKSFAGRVLSSWFAEEHQGGEGVQVSMRYRTMGGMHRAFMYGPYGDSEDSTGSVSLTAVRGGLRTASGRESPVLLVLDEPDTGLSEDYAYAMGAYIAQQVQASTNEKWLGTLVVTHSRQLVQGLLDSSSLRPHFVHTGSAMTLEQWLQGGRRRSVEELLALNELSHVNHRAIDKALKPRT